MNIPCEIKAASVDNGMLTLAFTPWLNTSTSISISLATPDRIANAAGQRLLFRISHALRITKLDNSGELVGRTLTLKLAQPKVAAGIHGAPVVVEVVTC